VDPETLSASAHFAQVRSFACSKVANPFFQKKPDLVTKKPKKADLVRKKAKKARPTTRKKTKKPRHNHRKGQLALVKTHIA